jgi:hypothetical protein
MNNGWEGVEQVLEESIEMQQQALLKCGRRIVPNLTPDDILQPNDFIELENNPHFRYEEGLLHGLQSAQMALRALKNQQLEEF